MKIELSKEERTILVKALTKYDNRSYTEIDQKEQNKINKLSNKLQFGK
jgi:hypothetical protein